MKQKEPPKPEHQAGVDMGIACVHMTPWRASGDFLRINGKRMNAMTSHGLVEENVHAIGQLVGLLDELPENLYRQCFGSRKQHVIGKHVRHIIDHYSSLLWVTASGDRLLDYENRDRDLALETDRRAGRNRLAEISQTLRRRFEAQCSNALLMRHNSDGQPKKVATSVDRELVFLASHTVHHMALIGMLAEQAGVEVSADFGVHPSTLRYLEKQASGLAESA
ncbi:DinB family protein [Marinobacter sp.]|uniref:DinB family protein n=1 Tax=Marinobacter sp. TaxID=50741 RepID=UPI002B45A598|nr:DinB family protein [Marinobacter sp.]HKK56055.1 DinB family protein [Marinobacter sp.]